MSRPVEVMLDLRAWGEAVPDSQALLALWRKVEPSLVGRELSAGQALQVGKSDGSGRLGVNVLAVPGNPTRVATDTSFAVHSVLEPTVSHVCGICSAQGRSGYGPLLCRQSAWEGKVVRLCPEHAVMLEGGLFAFHPERVPACSSGSGQPASFWCFGPFCHGKPWARDQRRAHPHDTQLIFCPRCHKELFSPCSERNCRRIGDFRCEYIELGRTESCHAAVCAQHCVRWQIFGPDRDGLVLCARHANVQALSDDLLVLQICLGTASRNLHGRRGDPDTPPLPTLALAQHLFLNVRKKPYDLKSLQQLFLGVEGRVGGNHPLDREVVRLINQRKQKWEDEVGKLPDPRGPLYLEQVRQAYRDRGLDRVADSLRLSMFKPARDGQPPLLFVYVDHDLIGLMKGKQGANIRAVSDAVGVKVALERDA